jgi:hypothetical protein
MDAFSGLFESHRLLFTIPLLFALFLGSLSVLGLFDLEAVDLDLGFDTDVDLGVDADLDADLDADVDPDVEAGGGGVLQLLGLGMIPFSLLLIVLCFSFGWLGLLLEFLLLKPVSSWVGVGWGLTLSVAPLALIGALLVTAPTARMLHPLFKDYGRAKDVHHLLGKRATLTSGSVSTTFGSASAQLDHGQPVDISVRTTEDENDLGYGDNVLIFDYDAENDLYYVAPLSEDEEILLDDI